MKRKRSMQHGEDDLVARLEEALTSNKIGALTTLLKGLLADADANDDVLSGAVCKELYKTGLDSALLQFLGTAPATASKLIAQYFSSIADGVRSLSTARRKRLDALFARVHDIVAESVLDDLDRGVDVTEVDLRRPRTVLKQNEADIQVDGAALLSLVRLASLNMLMETDFDGFGTGILMLELLRGCYTSGVDAFFDALEESESAQREFFEDTIDNSKAVHVELMTLCDKLSILPTQRSPLKPQHKSSPERKK